MVTLSGGQVTRGGNDTTRLVSERKRDEGSHRCTAWCTNPPARIRNEEGATGSLSGPPLPAAAAGGR